MHSKKCFWFFLRLNTIVILVLSIPVGFLHAEETEPLVGGLFVPELTVERLAFNSADVLSIEEVNRLTLIRNVEIQNLQLDIEKQGKEIQIAKAIYDTQFEAFGDYEQSQEQQASVVLGNRIITGTYGASLAKVLPTGTQLKLEYGNTRTSTNSTFTALPRYYDSYGKASFQQPLLRNFLGHIDRKRIKQVKIDTEKFDFETLDQLEEKLYQTRLLYWDLRFAYENLLNRRKALRKAQDFYKINHDKLDMGLSEKTDVFASESNVRKRVVEVLEAENELRSISYALRVELDIVDVPFLLPSREKTFDPEEVNLVEESNQALENRRDMKALLLEIEKQQIELKIKSSERLPELFAEGGYSSTGLDRQSSSSQGEVFGANHPIYEAGVRLKTSLENRDKRALYDQTKIGYKQLNQLRDLLQKTITKEVDDAYRNLLLAKERVYQTAEIKKLEEEKLSEEDQSFNRGRSSAKRIIDFQEDLINGKTESIRAIIQYKKARDAFLRVTNQLIKKI